MVPLDPASAQYVRSWLGGPRGPGLLDLHHALAWHQRGLWGDDAKAPRSVVLLRGGRGRLEAFGAGEPEPAVGWLVERSGPMVVLLAPEEWEEPLERRVGEVERVEALTLSLGSSGLRLLSTPVVTRPLTPTNVQTFFAKEEVPEWALASWLSVEHFVAHGAGYVVPTGVGAAAVSWIYSQIGTFEAVGVYTAPRFRRLGLGRAVASALVAEIVAERGKVPLWTTAPENAASLALARSLGFSVATSETLLRWRPASGSS